MPTWREINKHSLPIGERCVDPMTIMAGRSDLLNAPAF